MYTWDEFYLENSKLDDIYSERYAKDYPDYYKRNAIGFIIELGEFVNETKCFKYWTIKKPNMDDVLEEFADCLGMILCLAHNFGLEKVEIGDIRMCDDILECINDTYRLSTDLLNNGSKELCLDILNHLMCIASLLDLKEEDILSSAMKKIKKNIDRLNSDY